MGDFLGDFSLSLGNFLTETSGHPGDKRIRLPSGGVNCKGKKFYFIGSTIEPNVIKRFSFILYECSFKARVFDPGKPFQPKTHLGWGKEPNLVKDLSGAPF